MLVLGCSVLAYLSPVFGRQHWCLGAHTLRQALPQHTYIYYGVCGTLHGGFRQSAGGALAAGWTYLAMGVSGEVPSLQAQGLLLCNLFTRHLVAHIYLNVIVGALATLGKALVRCCYSRVPPVAVSLPFFRPS